MSAETSNVPCPDRNALQGLLTGEVDEGVRQVLEDHVELCEVCQTTLQQLSEDSVLSRLFVSCGARSEDTTHQFLRNLALPTPATSSPGQADVAAPFVQRIPEIPGFHQWEWLGRGGAGAVYRAWQSDLARWVAIKILLPQRSPTHANRVLREAKILGRLSHPHIVRIHETGDFQGQPYLVLEWISGGSLQQRLQHGVLAIRQAAELGHQLALALEAVHALGIIHRDLKPANVLMQMPVVSVGDNCDAAPVAKLTDFGIAVEPAQDERLTFTGQVVGTPHYMAPEQTGLAPHLAAVGPATDIYGLGAVLYAALTGQAPHGANSSLAVLREVASGEPRSPRVLRPEISRDLETIVLKCLRNDPTRRYRSAGELAEDLQRYLQGRPIHARPYSGFEKMCYWMRRQPLWGTVAALGALLAAVSIVGGAYHQHETRRLSAELRDTQQQVAQTEAAVQNEREESRRARWEALQQLTARSEAALNAGGLAPEQRRDLLETVRKHYRNWVQDLDHRDLSTAIELACGLEQLTGLEEREGLLTQALADLDLLDRVVVHFDSPPDFANHMVRRDLQRVRVLIQLRRLEEAAAQIDAMFERVVARTSDPSLELVLRGLAHLGWAARREGKPSLILPQVERALSAVDCYLEERPNELPIWRGRFELLVQKLHVLDPQDDPHPRELVEQDWLRFARELSSLPTPPELSAWLARLQLWQRIADLGGECSATISREILPLWIHDIGEFENVRAELVRTDSAESREKQELTCQAELVVQHVASLTLQTRLEAPQGPQPSVHRSGWREALRQAGVYLGRNPFDRSTRRRLCWTLIAEARHALPHDARHALECGQEAHQLLAPASGTSGPDAEERQLLADALYLSASSLRSLGQLRECRQNLERAYLISQERNRDFIAADLVRVHVDLGDLAGARKAASWILTDGPHLKEARRLLGELSKAQVSQ